MLPKLLSCNNTYACSLLSVYLPFDPSDMGQLQRPYQVLRAAVLVFPQFATVYGVLAVSDGATMQQMCLVSSVG